MLSAFELYPRWVPLIREMQRKVKFLAKGTKVSSHIKEFFQPVLILLFRPKVQSLEAMPPDSQSKALPSVERQTQGPQGDSTFLTQQEVDASSLPAALPPVISWYFLIAALWLKSGW